jgi:acetylornithine deacetylase/succinyl-diaminopimelate desuccinylase-like protein
VIFGPGNVAQAHGVDEYIDLRGLRQSTVALALTVVDARLKEVPRLER